MLVLSRKSGESILINPGTKSEARIEIVEIRGDKVRLGITVDKSIPVHREEVWAQIQGKRKEGTQQEGAGTP